MLDEGSRHKTNVTHCCCGCLSQVLLVEDDESAESVALEKATRTAAIDRLHRELTAADERVQEAHWKAVRAEGAYELQQRRLRIAKGQVQQHTTLQPSRVPAVEHRHSYVSVHMCVCAAVRPHA